MKALIPSVAMRKNFSETQDFSSKYNAVHLDSRFQIQITKELKLIVYQPVLYKFLKTSIKPKVKSVLQAPEACIGV